MSDLNSCRREDTVWPHRNLTKWLLRTKRGNVQTKTKLVKMPRGEYLRKFARDSKNNYIGIEPERAWREEDLDKAFSKYNDGVSAKWVVRSVGNLVFMEEMSK